MTGLPDTQTIQECIDSVIRRLWESGLDTMAIAVMTGVPESYAYNLLAVRPVSIRRIEPILGDTVLVTVRRTI